MGDILGPSLHRIIWTKEDILALPRDQWPPVPITCEGDGMCVTGRIVPEHGGPNVFVVFRSGGVQYEEEQSWGAVLQALNDCRYRVPVTPTRKPIRFATPGMDWHYENHPGEATCPLDKTLEEWRQERPDLFA